MRSRSACWAKRRLETPCRAGGSARAAAAGRMRPVLATCARSRPAAALCRRPRLPGRSSMVLSSGGLSPGCNRFGGRDAGPNWTYRQWRGPQSVGDGRRPRHVAASRGRPCHQSRNRAASGGPDQRPRAGQPRAAARVDPARGRPARDEARHSRTHPRAGRGRTESSAPRPIAGSPQRRGRERAAGAGSVRGAGAAARHATIDPGPHRAYGAGDKGVDGAGRCCAGESA